MLSRSIEGGDRLKSRWHIGRVVKSFDSFGKEVPHINIQGRGIVKTTIGGFLSLCIGLTTICFAIAKFIQLYEKANPIVSDLEIPEAVP